MPIHDFDRLFDQFNQLAVGYGPIFRDFNHATSTYPPHNIITVSDNEFYLELAVAGFKKHEITIQEENGLLTIMSAKDTKDADKDEPVYQYRGLAKRSFSRSFRIAEYFEIQEASMEDGILTVKFIKNTPPVTAKMIAIK